MPIGEHLNVDVRDGFRPSTDSPDAVYFTRHTFFADVLGNSGAGNPAFQVRGLDPVTNQPTVLFGVNKDGSTTVATNVGILGAALTGTLPNPNIAVAYVSTNMIASGAITPALMASGAAFTNVGALGAALVGTLPNPNLASAYVSTNMLASGAITGPAAGSDIARFVSSTNYPRNLIFIPAGTTATQINAIGTQATASGPLTLSFEPSTYTGPLIINSWVNYKFNWSKVTVASGANYSGVLQSAAFSANGNSGATTNSGVGDVNFRISEVIIDGNQANQSSGNGIGLAIYGDSYTVEKFIAHDCRGPGIWDEWNAPGLVTLPTWITGAVGGPAANWSDIELYNNGTNGAGTITGITCPSINDYGGGHVSGQWVHLSTDHFARNVFIWQGGSVAARQRGLHVGISATNQDGSLKGQNLHVYLNHDVGVDLVGNPTFISDIDTEGANINLLLRDTGHKVTGLWSYSTFSGGDAIRVDNGAAKQLYVEGLASLLAQGTNVINWVNGGDYSEYHLRAIATSATINLTHGTVPAHGPKIILNDGGGFIIGSSIGTLGV